MASREIGCVSVRPPGVPVLESPKRSLLTAPSIWIELYRLFLPATDILVPVGPLAATLTYGLLRAKSWNCLRTVGRALISSSGTPTPDLKYPDQFMPPNSNIPMHQPDEN